MHTAESAAEAIATQQKFLDFLPKVVLDSRIALGYLLAEQGGVCAVATPLAVLELTFLGKLRLSLSAP